MIPFLQPMIEALATLLAAVLRPLRTARISGPRRRKKLPRKLRIPRPGQWQLRFQVHWQEEPSTLSVRQLR